MFKKILLPRDGSELPERAVLTGVSVAKKLGTEVIGRSEVAALTRLRWIVKALCHTVANH